MTEELKPHQIAQLVNKLRDIAREFHAHDCLRELISREVNSALTQRPAAQTEREAFESYARDQGFPLKKLETGDGEDYLDLRTQVGWEFYRLGRASLPAPQQATPEPVGEPVAWQRRDRNIVTGEWSEWHEDDDIEEELDPEWAERRPLFTRPAPGVPEDVANLLCSVADNLNDMPISDEYAAKTAKKAYDLLVKYGLVSTPSELLTAAQAKGDQP